MAGTRDRTFGRESVGRSAQDGTSRGGNQARTPVNQLEICDAANSW
jgi:hypothetical protein